MLYPVQPVRPEPFEPPDPSEAVDADGASVEQLDVSLRDRLAAMDHWVVPRLQRLAASTARRVDDASRTLVALEDGLADGWPVGLVTRHVRVVAFLVASMLLAGAAVHMDRYAGTQEASDGVQEITEAGEARASGGLLAGGEGVEVGPTVGEAVDAYISRRSGDVLRLDAVAVRVAIVSFREPLDAGALATLLADLDLLRVQFLNPQASSRPLSSEVEGSIARTIEGAVAAVQTMAAEERDNAQALLDDGNITDPSFADDYRRRVVEMEELLQLLDGDPAIVFAVVVEGDGATLRRVADQSAVRLVDVAPAETSLPDSGFWGLLPTDTEIVTFGRG